MKKAALLAVSLGVLSVGFCSSADAAVVTVGSPAKAGVTSIPFSNVLTLIEPRLTELGSNVVSPVNGTIVRWHVTGFAGGPFSLRVLTPVGGNSYTGGVASAPQVPASKATETFATSLPIKAGQAIGIDNANGSDEAGAFNAPGASLAFFEPPLAEGVTRESSVPSTGFEIAFNAEVQPAPTVAAISPTSGSIKGGTKVTIIGTDLEAASAVSFGGTAARSFTVDSESQITAFAPATPKPAGLPVAVTTIAGTATSPVTFGATACVVPKLNAKKLTAAKKALKKADCKLGKVKKLNGATSKTGKVKSQSPKVGKVLAPGSKVNVKLG